ncbi:MAG TPA: formate dehydrogenase accessory sulfurtransferase FdhD [Acidimicrobiales bacterium]|nr:formate dehydrogenase accessory sulfurtransferase FdhD [Acidimicrobiales bacterium]
MTGLPTRGPVSPRRVVALRPGRRLELPDEVVTEEPLEVRVAGPAGPSEPVAVTMRTPGHDFELAVGFLLSEGVVGDRSWIVAVRYCDLGPGAEQELNVVTVHLDRAVDLGARRAVPVSAACGVCGTTSLDQLARRCRPLGPADPFDPDVLLGLPEALRAHQRLFDRTGGLHAAGLFDRAGQPRAVREDVGRHNAVDKLLGWSVLGGTGAARDAALVVSGRVSFEIVQKAAVLGTPVIVAVSAPSSLAVDTAEHLGICLLGFARGSSANVYSHPERVAVSR